MLARSGLTMLFGTLLVCTPTISAFAIDLESQPPEITFNQVLESIREAANAPQQERIETARPVVEEWLNNLVRRLQAATGRTATELPIRFDNYLKNPNNQAGFGGLQDGGVHVEKDVRSSRKTRAIVLADGVADISFADDCIIIARGAIRVAHGSGNILIAGHYVHVSHEGNRLRRVPPGENQGPIEKCGIAISGNIVDISHAHSTIVSTPGTVSIGHAHDVIFLNCLNSSASHKQRTKSIDDVSIALMLPLAPTYAAPGIDITQIEVNDAHKGFAVVKQNDVELIWRPGKPLVDGNGKPVAALENWRIVFLDRNYALLTDGKDYASILLKP